MPHKLRHKTKIQSLTYLRSLGSQKFFFLKFKKISFSLAKTNSPYYAEDIRLSTREKTFKIRISKRC